MKRIALVAAVLFTAACGNREEAPVVDSAAPAMAPAPADTAAMPMDTMMKHDTTADTTAK